ncbi:MAG: hypothetical protein KBC02_04315 [Candidatus Pacebacteria bacterium]|nr:hypothetical protein [Candidatus Paceibacterota bacterium]
MLVDTAIDPTVGPEQEPLSALEHDEDNVPAFEQVSVVQVLLSLQSAFEEHVTVPQGPQS